MNQEFRNKLTEAAIREMQTVLDDPNQDPEEHATERCTSINLLEDGRVESYMHFGEMDGWVTERHESSITDGEITGTIRLRTNPHSLILRITNQATANIFYLNPETGKPEIEKINPAQQQALDRYASKVAFRLTGVANGELLDDDEDAENRETLDGKELLEALIERVTDTCILAEELALRGSGSETLAEREEPPDEEEYLVAAGVMGVIQGLQATQVNLMFLTRMIMEEIEENPEHGKWGRPRLD